jgi:hypothetical protein
VAVALWPIRDDGTMAGHGAMTDGNEDGARDCRDNNGVV